MKRIVEVPIRRLERQDEEFAVAARQQVRGRNAGPALVVDVDRRRGIGVTVDDHEGNAAPPRPIKYLSPRLPAGRYPACAARSHH